MSYNVAHGENDCFVLVSLGCSDQQTKGLGHLSIGFNELQEWGFARSILIDHGELEGSKAENERLIAMLEQHCIEWRLPPRLIDVVQESTPSLLSPTERVALFMKLFRGQFDVYPACQESKTAGKSGYTSVCAHEQRAGVCDKPRIKRADCHNRQLIPLSEYVIYEHLAGRHSVGIYSLPEDDTSHLLAIDIDEADCRDDACEVIRSCEELEVLAALEISQSGKGAHVFFCQ